MKIKVLFFIESLNFGGAEKSFLSLINHLDPEKYDLDVLVIRGNGALEKNLPNFVNYRSINPVYSPLSRLKYLLFRKFYTKRHNAQHFWKAFKNEFQPYTKDYDLAISWGQGFATYFVAEKINAKKKLAWVNIDYEKAGYVFKHDKEIYNRFDFVNGVSPFVNDVMAKYINKEKLIQIPNIIDVKDVLNKSTEKCPVAFDKGKFNIVSLGRLAKQKAFELSLEAAQHLKHKEINFHWYIVGDGSERKMLENMRRELNIENEVTFTGFQHNPYSFVQQSDLYVQTSIFEGLGRTLIEATMLNKPIVTTDFETAFSLVDQNQTGIITPKKPKEIADAIYKLYNEKDTYGNMIENLKSKSRISADAVVFQFDNLIDNLFNCRK